jgi:hypothetical protein
MVHRTDITGRSMGQANPGHDGACRPALNGALLENNFSLRRPEVLPSPQDGSPGGLHAIYLERLTVNS